MSAVDDILVEVCLDADWRNAEVLQAAFRARGIRCPSCDYPQNAAVFERLLSEYTSHKIEEHYHWVRYDPPYWREWEVGGSTLHLRHHQTAILRANNARQMLQRIWPCATCMQRFNPTARFRRSFKDIPKRFPQQSAIKEFMDD
jgi:hypothetical protein